MSEAREGDEAPPHVIHPSAMRQWLRRFTDPMVFVALIAAVASASFAWQTNQISQRQVELMNRQVGIVESLALPIFTVTIDAGNDSEADAPSDWITITNSGGLASDLSIDVLPYLSYWWLQDDDTGRPVRTQGAEVPLAGYFDEYSHVLPVHMNPGTTTPLGFDGNAAALSGITDQLTSQLAAKEGVSELDFGLEILVSLNYVDYTGVERADYYVAHVSSTGEVFPPQQFMRLTPAVGEEIWLDYYGKFDNQFVILIDQETELPGDDEVEALGKRIYDQRTTDLWLPSTPVAQVRG